MTCIIGHASGWIVADRQEQWGDLIGPPLCKIRRTPQMIYGLCGDTGAVESRLRGYRWGNDHLVDLADLVHDAPGCDYSMVAVNQTGLHLIAGDGGITRVDPHSNYWAMGSGRQVALGYLSRIQETVPVTQAHAESAIKCASMLCPGVGSAVDVMWLDD